MFQGIRRIFVVAIGIALATGIAMVPAQAQGSSIETDYTGYKAGDPVKISGSGFRPREEIAVQVTHADGTAETGFHHEPVWMQADATGSFSASWAIQALDSEGPEFLATAKGLASGASATAAFRRIAVVQTDKYDYPAGATAALSGEGFNPNETVTLHVWHLSGLKDGAGHLPFTTSSDANGRISSTWFVDPDDSLGAILMLTARGEGSGLVAQTVFTDPPLEVIDDQGPDDQPGQKDLNKMTSNLENIGIGQVAVTWQWDDTSFGPLGGNTGDGCALFDSDDDGQANFAVCATVDGNPATWQNTRVYSCGDARSDRCSQPVVLLSGPTTTCSATVGNSLTDPFRTGQTPAHGNGNVCSDRNGNPSCLTEDTVASCTVRLVDFPNTTDAFLINVCSYPSQEPNSDPSDCVVTPNSGFLTIMKTVKSSSDTTEHTYAFTSNLASRSGAALWSKGVQAGLQDVTVTVEALISFAAGDITLTEGTNLIPIPSNWKLTDITCSISDGTTTDGTFNSTTNSISGVTIKSGLVTTCTFTNSPRQGSIELKKVWVGGASSTLLEIKTSGGVLLFDANADGTTDSTGAHDVDTGIYKVSETGGLIGYDSKLTCVDNANNSTDLPSNESTTGPVSVQVDEGDVIVCTFTNTKKGNIVVKKETLPDSDTTNDFTFDPSWSGTNFPLKDGGTNFASGAGLAPNAPYSVVESDPTSLDYDLTQVQCVSALSTSTGLSGDADTRTATIGNLAPGDTVTCTFTNTKRGKIIIRKLTLGGDGEFTFATGSTPTGGSDLPDTFKLTAAGWNAGNPNTPGNSDADTTANGDGEYVVLPANGYVVTETSLASAFGLESISCSDLGGLTPSATDLATKKATINVSPGETVTCTFTNTTAAMPFNKLTNGVEATCAGTPETCTANGKSVPQFYFNLYNQVPPLPACAPNDGANQNGCPGGVQYPGTGTVTAPNSSAAIPDAELPGFTDVPLTVCELGQTPGWQLPLGTGAVMIHLTPYGGGQASDLTPTVYSFTLPDPYGASKCFNIYIPPGTKEFAITVDNVQAKMSIVKTATIKINYSFKVTNTGGFAIPGPIVVKDDVLGPQDVSCTLNNEDGAGSATDLDPTETATCTGMYEPANNKSPLTNTAHAEALNGGVKSPEDKVMVEWTITENPVP